METSLIFEKAKNFIYRNARPLDLSRFQYHFENGSKEAVLAALSVYQNDDGGFGHALEADCWNPNSSPIQTWAATGILQEIEFFDCSHPIVAGLLRYLESGRNFDGHIWSNVIESNNEYPHAPWWHFTPDNDKEVNYNPTAGLVGFLLQCTRKGEGLNQLACRLAQEAVAAYLPNGSADMHLVGCYLQLMGGCVAADQTSLFDFPAFTDRLKKDVLRCIEPDSSRWTTEYVCRPSQMILSPDSPFYPQVKQLIRTERDVICETQMEDGAWPITWEWGKYPETYFISANFWRANLVINHLLFLRNFRIFE